jgi:biopolymer transport protein ExbB
MNWWNSTIRLIVLCCAWGFLGLVLTHCVEGAGDSPRVDRVGGGDPADSASVSSVSQPGARAAAPGDDLAEQVSRRARQWVRGLAAWYQRTPPQERVTWGGLAACAGLGLVVLLERMVRLRRRKIVPAEFTERFLDRLHEGKLDCGQALDHCELNPSPAARVALAAVRRWGRPASDLERAVALAHRVETERLRRNVGTLRRIAALAPLLGLLGTLFALGQVLEAIPAVAAPAPAVDRSIVVPGGPGVAWGRALAAALTPLSTGIILATLALVAYDGVLTRVEKLAGALDRLGAETIEAIALTAPIVTPPIPMAPVPIPAPSPSSSPSRWSASQPVRGPATAFPPARTPHQGLLRREQRTDSLSRPADHEIGF